MSTAFERCGGFACVRRIVSDFYDRVLDSPRLAAFFEDVDMRALIDHQTQFVAWIMGGPIKFNEKSLRRAHAHLGIDRDAYREVTRYLLDAMADNGVAQGDIDMVATQLARRESLIVSTDNIDAA